MLDKYNLSSVPDADREILTRGLTDNAGNEVSEFPALFVDTRGGISRSASVTDV